MSDNLWDEYTPTQLELQEAWISTYATRDGQLTEKAILQGQAEFKRFLASRIAEATKPLEDKFAEVLGQHPDNAPVRLPAGMSHEETHAGCPRCRVWGQCATRKALSVGVDHE